MPNINDLLSNIDIINIYYQIKIYNPPFINL